MSRDNRIDAQAGFTLVETIAAMAILSLAALPLLQLVTNSVRGSAMLELRLLARTVAENIVVEEVTEPASMNEEIEILTGTSEQLGRSFRWTLTRSPATEGVNPQLVTVEVRHEQRPQVLSTMRAVRLPVLSEVYSDPADSHSELELQTRSEP